jgi:hypothetical protein
MDRSPSEDEAAAIAAAVERFVAEEAAASVEAGLPDAVGPWQWAALIEGVGAKASIVDLEGEGGGKWLS